MVDPVEELLQVHVHHDPPPRLHVRLRGQHRIVRTPPGPEAVAVLAEGGIKQRLQHLQQRLLDQPVRHRRDAQLALATVRLRDRHPPYRTRPVRPPQQPFANVRPSGLQVLPSLFDVQTVHPRRPLVRLHPPPRLLQVLSRQRRRKQRLTLCLRCRAAGLGLRRWTLRARLHRALPRPPGSLRHLTHGPRHRHVLVHFHSFGPSPRTGSYYGLG